MKKKFKNIAIVQKKGAAEVKKFLKKYVQESITTPTDFFYDTAFDYGDKDGQQPLLIIGQLPLVWKNYVKQNKQSTTLLKGKCVIHAGSKAELLLFGEVGKGGKPLVIKQLNKDLLKPFAAATLVDSLEQLSKPLEPAVAESGTSEATVDKGFELTALEESAKAVSEQPATIQAALSAVVTQLGQPLQNIKDTIVTDALIAEAKAGLQTIATHDVAVAIKALGQWLKEASNTTTEGAQAVIAPVESLQKELEALVQPLQGIAQNAAKLELVQDPLQSENVAPISEDPIQNFLNQMNKSARSSGFAAAVEQAAKF